MRVTGSRVYSRPPPAPTMPQGLVELMEGLTKDVLKNNPDDVNEYCAEHMRKLLEIRDGPTTKKTISLEQKILKAQEKVRKRAEQRWRRLKEESKEESKDNNCHELSSLNALVVNENLTPMFIKPVQHEEVLVKASELEISYEPGDESSNKYPSILTSDDLSNAQNDELENVASSIVVTNGIEQGENTSTNDTIFLHESNQTQEGNNNANAFQDEKEIVQNIDNIEQPKSFEHKEDAHNPPQVLVSVFHKNEEVAFKANDAIAIEEYTVTETEKEKVKNMTQSEIKAELNAEGKANNDLETTQGTSAHQTNGNITLAIEKTHNDVSKNENDDNIENSEKHENVEIIGIDNDKVVITSNVDNADDFEDVVNDAIEVSKRKDSSADDLSKDITVNEEESDNSDNSNKNSLVEESTEIEQNINVSHSNEANTLETPVIHVNNKKIKDSLIREAEPIFQDFPTNDNLKDASEAVLDEENEKFCDYKELKSATDKVCESTVDDAPQNTTMDLETAAATIQKVFRTFLFKRASTFDETGTDENNLSYEEKKKDDRIILTNNVNKERRPLGISRMDTVLQTVNEEKSLSLSTDDSSLSSAATIIQAHVRGFLVRNKFNSGKTSSSSLVLSNGHSGASLDGDADYAKSKTILNIHIVPEGGNYLSRDESMITSMDLSLDGSPPSSVNLHPLGYNTSERRKQLKREDAVQSVSPPSNNSGKLSEDVDSVKELTIIETNSNPEEKTSIAELSKDDSRQEIDAGSLEISPTNSLTIGTVIEGNITSNTEMLSSLEVVAESPNENKKSLTKQSSDEMDVVTPFIQNKSTEEESKTLLHTGEFHDAVLPTKLSRCDTPVVSGE